MDKSQTNSNRSVVVDMQFYRYLLAPGVCNPLAALTTMLVLGPMPALMEDLPDDLRILADECRVNQATLWELFMFYWPSFREPPYVITEGWIWVWSNEGGVETWEIVGLR